MEDRLREVSLGMINRYSKRYHSLGYNVKTLGWGTEEQQIYRFLQTLDSNNISFEEKNILDLGCGFGDYAKFLEDQNIVFSHYIGWDINPDLIQEAQRQFLGKTNITFSVNNLLELSTSNNLTVADIGVMLGLLNLNLQKNNIDNYEYSRLMINNAFNMVNDLLIVDFLSTYTTSSYPQEEFIFYHDPKIMLEFALSLSPNVVLKHNYAPIPQKEFMLFIYKQ